MSIIFVMSKEIWHETIRGQKGEIEEAKFWVTPLKPVDGHSVLQVSLISVIEDNNRGITEGVYAYTNLSLKAFKEQPILHDLLNRHVFREIGSESLSTITEAYISSNETVVFRIHTIQLVSGFNIGKN